MQYLGMKFIKTEGYREENQITRISRVNKQSIEIGRKVRINQATKHWNLF